MRDNSFTLIQFYNGEVAEWSKAHDWVSAGRLEHRGECKHSLHRLERPAKEGWAGKGSRDGCLRDNSFTLIQFYNGEVAEWSKAHDWVSAGRLEHRGECKHSLHRLERPAKEGWAGKGSRDGCLRDNSFKLIQFYNGEVAEWSKAHDWVSAGRLEHRGGCKHCLHRLERPAKEGWAGKGSRDGCLRDNSFTLIQFYNGEVAEWSKAHDWNSCKR